MRLLWAGDLGKLGPFEDSGVKQTVFQCFSLCTQSQLGHSLNFLALLQAALGESPVSSGFLLEISNPSLSRIFLLQRGTISPSPTAAVDTCFVRAKRLDEKVLCKDDQLYWAILAHTSALQSMYGSVSAKQAEYVGGKGILVFNLSRMNE